MLRKDGGAVHCRGFEFGCFGGFISLVVAAFFMLLRQRERKRTIRRACDKKLVVMCGACNSKFPFFSEKLKRRQKDRCDFIFYAARARTCLDFSGVPPPPLSFLRVSRIPLKVKDSCVNR